MNVVIHTSPDFVKRIGGLLDVNKFIKTGAFDALSQMTERIHEKGEAADGSGIGTYTNNYLKLRQKKPYNRTADSKIIVSLTRRLENDWGVIQTDKGNWAIAFLNKKQDIPEDAPAPKDPKKVLKPKKIVTSGDKMKFVEESSGKTIAALSKPETEQLIKTILKGIDESLSQ